jgi:hypothetical protein
MVTLLTIPQLGAPGAAATGSSCTGWTSQVDPPRTIRVLRTRTGKVQKVDFRRYVAEVMASGEWPDYLHQTTLEAGAVATKQYAWYYALKGHHRHYYRSGGRCYDVRDDTQDQLFRPEGAKPTAKQRRAIDATWGLSLRKEGRFFLTGYRAGVTSECAADANGWKLYALSVEACAREGWSRQRIQRAYLSPNLAFVWSPAAGPVLASPQISLRAGSTMPHDAVTVEWRPTVLRGDVHHYTLQRQVGRGDWKPIPLAAPGARKARVWLKTGVDSQFRVRATDLKGRTGPWAYSPERTAALRGPVGLRLAGTTTVAAVRRKGWASVRVTGRSIALVARTGPGMGWAKVFVDGRRAAVVDLGRPAAAMRKLVWAKNYVSAKRRRVAVKAAGPSGPIEFRGFYVLR